MRLLVPKLNTLYIFTFTFIVVYYFEYKMQYLRKYVVKSAFKSYLPEDSDFELIEEVIPDLKDGEFLVQTEYISVDPYMRSFARDNVPYTQFGFQVGKVVNSRHSGYPRGIYVVSHSEWSDHVVLTDAPDNIFNIVPYQPDVGNLPISYSLGCLGMPGVTAYLGLLKVCKPMSGDVVCVTSAAGAVGSLVSQIAKIKGCTVIGFTGSDEKVHVLSNEYGVHYAFNYKTVTNVKDILKSCAPNGIDCYFDNVGGDLAADIIDNMKPNGRVAICGSISTYGSKNKSRSKLKKISATIESFGFPQWEQSDKTNSLKEIKKWIESGDIKVRETIINGFEELPNALIGMLKGENIGKAIVKL